MSGKKNNKVGVFGLGLLPPSARKPSLIVAACRKALQSEKASLTGELNVIFFDRQKMRELNKRYLNHSHDTDVIAFNYDADAPGSPFGDVYVSAYQAKIQAKELGHPLLREILTLVIHGTLHLLGHDDSTPRKKAVMFAKQDEIIRKVGNTVSRAAVGPKTLADDIPSQIGVT